MHSVCVTSFDLVEEAIRHIMFHHEDASGWVTLAKKGSDRSWKQYHYIPKQLSSVMADWNGENVYFSQNTFYKPQRRIENIRELRALYVDVDCHKLGLEPRWVAEKLNLEVFQELLPVPNYTLFSGRGVVFIWLIEPVPSQVLPLWKAVQFHFYTCLEYVGADKKSLDATRVFRVAGSINSKNGQTVSVEFRHKFKYSLRDLQEEYLPALTPKEKRIKKPGRKEKVLQLYNLRSLNYTRLLDLTALVQMRNHDLKGHREYFCFLYRYWSCCLSDDLEKSLKDTLEFNNEFKEPLLQHEVEKATQSAEKAWLAKNDMKANEEAISKGYPGAGYNLKNTTIIHWLKITSEEQECLQTIIDANEKRRRKRKRDKYTYRIKNGSESREAYLEKQKEKTANRLWQLKEASERNPYITNTEMAVLLDVSESYIRKLKKKETSPNSSHRSSP